MQQGQARKTAASKYATKEEFQELKDLVTRIVKLLENPTSKEAIDYDDDENDNINISSDSYIKVMSLTPYHLTLTTQALGKGKKFDFKGFGEVKRILYRDLVDIMEQHSNFLMEGYYVILNRDVIRKHGLDDAYEKILDKSNIEKILSGNQSDAVNLFKSCNDTQREHISNMITAKIVAGESVDLNLLDRLSRVIGYDIAERGEEMKKVSKLNEKEK